ncbi:MAG TPA: TIGR03067 domain-containing protein [Gemmataceae bacterium]|nr:TIGR03067 domain-containing protein [Gemmataceae bacterium]
MRIGASLILFAAVLVVAADKPPADGKKELEKLQGEWTIVSMETRGKKSSDDEIKGHTLTVKGDQWTFKTGNGRASTAKVKIDDSKNPKQIDLTFQAGAKQGPSRGIFKLEGDTMTLCRTRGDIPRPEEFKTTESAGLLVVWKKVAPTSPGAPKK